MVAQFCSFNVHTTQWPWNLVPLQITSVGLRVAAGDALGITGAATVSSPAFKQHLSSCPLWFLCPSFLGPLLQPSHPASQHAEGHCLSQAITAAALLFLSCPGGHLSSEEVWHLRVRLAGQTTVREGPDCSSLQPSLLMPHSVSS